jgi:hypothetical protein
LNVYRNYLGLGTVEGVISAWSNDWDAHFKEVRDFLKREEVDPNSWEVFGKTT